MNIKSTVIFSISPLGNAISDYFYELAKSFAKKDYNVVVIFYNSPKLEYEGIDGITHYVWPSKRPTKYKDFIFFANLIVKYKPQIVYSNFSSTNVIGLISYFFRIKKRYNYLHTSPLQLQIDSKLPYLKQTFLNIRKYLIYKLYTKFFTNSEGTKLDFIKKFNIEGEKIAVLPYLISQSNNPYKSEKLRKKQLIILGRLDKSKGHIELLKCFKEMLKNYNDYKLLIAGEGSQKQVLEQYIQDNHLSENIILLGKIPYKLIGTYISESVAHISSSYQEAFGLVNIEALREGTPIICTLTNGSKDILNEGSNGEFFSLDNENSFLEAFLKIKNNWKAYSNDSLESFNNKYSLNGIDNHFEYLIK